MSDHTVVRWKGDEFCWKCRITTLEAENKALREQFSRDMDFANKSYGDLKTENKALREAIGKIVKYGTKGTKSATRQAIAVDGAAALLTKEEL